MAKIDSNYLKDLDNFLKDDEEVEPEEELTVDDGLEGNIAKEDVRSTEQSLLYLLVDKSGSMYNNGLEEGVIEGLKEIKDVVNGSVESRDGIQTAMTFFGTSLDMRPFQYGERIDISYRAEDAETHLYDAIVESSKNMVSQYDKLESENKVKGVMLIITDGGENGSQNYTEKDVSKALEELEKRDIPVLLGCFAKADLTAFANKFSYMQKVTFEDGHKLRRMMRFVSLRVM